MSEQRKRARCSLRGLRRSTQYALVLAGLPTSANSLFLAIFAAGKVLPSKVYGAFQGDTSEKQSLVIDIRVHQ